MQKANVSHDVFGIHSSPFLPLWMPGYIENQKSHKAYIISQLFLIFPCHSMCTCGFYVVSVFVSVVISRDLLYPEVEPSHTNFPLHPHPQPLCLFGQGHDVIGYLLSTKFAQKCFYPFTFLLERPYLLFGQNFSVSCCDHTPGRHHKAPPINLVCSHRAIKWSTRRNPVLSPDCRGHR